MDTPLYPDSLQRAEAIATKAHAGQTRTSGEPYITHPAAVASILTELDLPVLLICAAWLHDVPEDTDEQTMIQIEEVFGSRVSYVVQAVTKLQKPNDEQKLYEEYQEDCVHDVHFRDRYNTFEEYKDFRFLLYVNRLYVAGQGDHWVYYVKIADQIHNLQTLGAFYPAKRQRKIREIREFFLPMYQKALLILSPKAREEFQALLSQLTSALSTQEALLQRDLLSPPSAPEVAS